jgi:hypothetical protein
MPIIWKGRGWWLPLIAILAALLLLPVEPMFERFGAHRQWLEAAVFAALVAIGTMAIARWQVMHDMKADKELSAKTAQRLHTLYWVSLTDWGYVLVLVTCGLFAAASLI